METKICVVCGCLKIEPLFTLRDYRLNNSKEVFNYEKCKCCGLIFQNPCLSAEALSKHYNQNKIYDSMIPQKGLKNILYEFGLQKRAQTILKVKEKGNLLDIGCGGGAFIRYMAKKSEYNVVGTELNVKNVDVLRHSYGIDVRQGQINEIDFHHEYFDAITMWDVLEHVEDPNITLQEIRKIIKPDGVLVVRVPNGDSLDFKIFKRYWAGLDAPRHLFVFSIESIFKLLENNSFKINSKQTNIGGYLNLINSIAFCLNDKEINPKIKSLLLKVFRSVFLQIFFFPFIWAKNHLLLGTSLTIVAQPVNNTVTNND